jgi:peptide/nickel transport system substrate-binding protein
VYAERDNRKPETEGAPSAIGLIPQAVTRRTLLERTGLTVAGLVAGGWLSACGGSSTPGVGTGGQAGGGKAVASVAWALNGEPVAMDYAKAYDYNTNVVVTNITEPLLRTSVDGKLTPNVAESWRQVDPRTLVLSIRPGIRFHDGSPLTAEDVAFSLTRHRDPKVASYLATFHDRVADVRAMGPHTVKVSLSKPDAVFLYALTTMAGAVASKAFIERHGQKVGTPGVGIVGTGPYKFSSWSKGQQVVLDRFDGYWNKDRALKVKRFVAKIILDEATIVEGLGSGQIDGVFGGNLSGKSLKASAALGSVDLSRAPSYQVHVLTFNTQRPPFADARVRQALSYAIDKDGLLASAWGGIGHAGVRSPAPPALWTFDRTAFQDAYNSLPAFGRDIAKAKSLIKQAGATGAKAEIMVSSPYEVEQAVAVQAAGKEIGLDIRVNQVEASAKAAAEFSGGSSRQYHAVIHQWGSDIPDPAGNLAVPFDSQNRVANPAVYHNASVDQKLRDQRNTTDPARRAKLLTEAQAQIVADQPWVVFYSPDAAMALNKRLGGYQMHPLWYWDPFAADLSGA